MKRLVILMLVLSLALSGCAVLNTGKVIKDTVNQGVIIVDEKICPTLETVKDTVEAATFLWPLIAANPKLYEIWLVFDSFSTGVCYYASQLREAMVVFDQAAPLQVGRAVMAKPQLKALRAAVK